MFPHYFNLGVPFAQILATYATHTALHYSERVYRYETLSQWMDSLCALLLVRGVKKGDVIAIAHTKQPLAYALMLAGIRLGVTYVIIDVASPATRLHRILDISKPSHLFFDDPGDQKAMSDLAEKQGCPLWLLEEATLPEVTDADRTEQHRLSRLVDGSCIAYIMFTSGSTGVPKGVAITHQNVLHFIAWGQERFGITEKDNFANLSPMFFDNSVFDFFVGLFSGASLSPVRREVLTNPYELVPYVGRMGCTVWFSVPSLLIYLMTMKALTPGSLPALRTIVFGGEGYPKVELKKLYDLFSRQATLVNVYGPTECTCICSSHSLGADDFIDLEGLPTLGFLNPNFDYRIFDEQGRDATRGELCLIGPNVGAGYFNDPELTGSVFRTLMDSNRFMKRMYCTGDQVREVNGRLDFIGRKDNQIKHLGYRIELEEIECALLKLTHVHQAAVVYHRVNAAYGKLVAYVASSEPLDGGDLLKALARSLPDYMVPSKVFVMSKLPINPNGKVDRLTLREMLDN
ncbi:MAG: AMP-binding protein [Elusimicrobia bacterium]|nr:AMP-binding protein [Elusimicrobiota bacterium]